MIFGQGDPNAQTPAPQPGAQSPFGGYFSEGGGGLDALSAIGQSLMTSDRLHPLGNVPYFLQQAQKDTAARQSKGALVSVLKSYGFDDETANKLASNKDAAELAIAQKQSGANAAANKAAFASAPSLNGFIGGGGGAGPSMSPPAPGGPAAGLTLNGNDGGGTSAPTAPAELASLFDAKEKEYNLPAGYLHGTAGIETGGKFNADAHNASGADGLFQFMPGTARDYQLANTRDPVASTDAAARYARDNGDRFRAAMGRDPSAGELYLMHQQGGGGGLSLIQNPDTPAGQLVAPGNIAGNGGDPRAPAGAFIQKWSSRFGGGAPVRTADASGAVPQMLVGAPGAPAQQGADPLAGFQPSTSNPYSSAPPGGPNAETPAQSDGTNSGVPGRAGVLAARADAASRPVPAFGSGATPPPPAPPPLRPGQRNVQVAENEDDTQRLEGRMSMYPAGVYGVAGQGQSPAPIAVANRTARPAATAQSDVPAPGAQAAAFQIPPGEGQVTAATARATASSPPSPERFAPETKTGRAYALRHYEYWAGQLATSGSNKNLAESAKAMMEVSAPYLKPTDIEQKLDAANVTGADRRTAIRNSIPDSRPSGVQEYEYGQRDPGYEAYQDRRKDGKEPKITEQAEQRRGVAASLGLKPGTPAHTAYVATGKLPNEDKMFSASDKKAILEADEAVSNNQSVMSNLKDAQALSKKAFSGPLAPYLGRVGSWANTDSGKATVEYDNLITTNALGQLKSIFGAAPTEGERKILLDIQGSSTQSQAVRDAILQRAYESAERRLEINRQRASEMRGGSYFKPDGGPEASRMPGATTSRAPAAPGFDPDALAAEARRRGLIQ